MNVLDKKWKKLFRMCLPYKLSVKNINKIPSYGFRYELYYKYSDGIRRKFGSSAKLDKLKCFIESIILHSCISNPKIIDTEPERKVCLSCSGINHDYKIELKEKEILIAVKCLDCFDVEYIILD